MKMLIVLVLAVGSLFGITVNQKESARYKDLNTGMAFNLVPDHKTGLMVDEETGKPLTIFIDTKTGDTIYGRTGEIINGKVIKVNKNNYAYGSASSAAATMAVAQ